MAYPLAHSHLLLKRLANLLPASLPPTQHWIILEGEKTLSRHDTGTHPYLDPLELIPC